MLLLESLTPPFKAEKKLKREWALAPACLYTGAKALNDCVFIPPTKVGG